MRNWKISHISGLFRALKHSQLQHGSEIQAGAALERLLDPFLSLLVGKAGEALFRCPNRIPGDPAACHYPLIQHCESATAELLWALFQKSCQRKAWHIQCQRSHWPAQLGCPHPIQPSLCLVPSLGSSVTALELLGSRGRDEGQLLLQAQSQHKPAGNQSWTRSHSQFPGTARAAGAEWPGLTSPGTSMQDG